MQIYLCKNYITVTKAGDEWMHGTPYCGHGYVPLKCGGGGCRYKNWNTTTKTGELMKLFTLGNGLYYVQSGVFLTKFGRRLLLFLSAQSDNV